MRRFITEGEGLPRWASPISHAVVTDNICNLRGQLPIDADGVYVPGSATDAYRLSGRRTTVRRTCESDGNRLPEMP